jgi:hypothetical protein
VIDQGQLDIKQENKMSTITFDNSLKNLYKSSVSLTRRGRFLARAAVISSSLVLIVAGYSAFAQSDISTSSKTTYQEIVVAPGQTLWSIAGTISDGDLLAAVDLITELNSLKSPELKAGQRIYIPIK